MYYAPNESPVWTRNYFAGVFIVGVGLACVMPAAAAVMASGAVIVSLTDLAFEKAKAYFAPVEKRAQPMKRNYAFGGVVIGCTLALNGYVFSGDTLNQIAAQNEEQAIQGVLAGNPVGRGSFVGVDRVMTFDKPKTAPVTATLVGRDGEKILVDVKYGDSYIGDQKQGPRLKDALGRTIRGQSYVIEPVRDANGQIKRSTNGNVPYKKTPLGHPIVY